MWTLLYELGFIIAIRRGKKHIAAFVEKDVRSQIREEELLGEYWQNATFIVSSILSFGRCIARGLHVLYVAAKL